MKSGKDTIRVNAIMGRVASMITSVHTVTILVMGCLSVGN